MLWKSVNVCIAIVFSQAVIAQDLKTQRQQLISHIKATHSLTDKQVAQLTAIMEKSPVMGQGNPATTKHPVTSEQCLEDLKKKKLDFSNIEYEEICGGKYMAPLFDPATQKASDAAACIDQFEYPNIPCEYPVVWVQANEAAEICEVMGKRLCDAHEWEGACEGDLQAPDYEFAMAKGLTPNAAVERMRSSHNAKEGKKKTWAYGGAGYQKGKCGGNSSKANDCNGGDWKKCGSNTYPSGSFPDCKSKLDVYDQHGNAAEHMNLPLDESQMASKGSKSLGYTEMKGSWFIFDKYYAHQDFCRWRAPYWHGTKVLDAKSHHNYHLGFRCCKTLDVASKAADKLKKPTK